ncbi:hypothetical protein [Mycobacterium sp. shizuoka-1]|uniref:hypothetical protein n=1 Tax=Mycobacterium sp. shizuoka-1 TaxID=2039281 RepID=UPI000C067D58|nr:hypothetical protein [Mycobacterium sp. shizuoka-1]GAY17411.1 hypothetical protein MSZK_41370 [Mycobacterium sp. shizuoka-1]
MAIFLRRFFGIGKLPREMREQFDSEGVIFLAEYVAVTRRFSGKVPGLRASGSVASYVGSLVFTSQRAVATLSSVPKLAGRTMDVRWNESQPGSVRAEISSSGVTLDVDVAAVDPQFSGQLSLTYKVDIPADVLTRLPTRHLEFSVPPEYVYRAVGVPHNP